MKGSMKKLALFVVIATIAMFISTAMAKDSKAVRGQYAATSESSCILSIFGFNADLTPACVPTPTGPLCIPIIQMHNRQGIYTFENDGTGSATHIGSTIQLSYSMPSGQVPSSGMSSTISWDFTYTVTDDGMITIKQVPGTYFVTHTSGPNKGKTYQTEGVLLTGAITPDGKNITLYGGPPNVSTISGPNIPPYGPNHLCQGSTALIWQHD